MVEKYSRENHFAEVSEWFLKRGDSVQVNRLPKIGYFIKDTLAVFIYWDKDTEIGFVHGLISNPDAKRKKVLLGLKDIMTTAKRELKGSGINTLIYFTKFNSLLKAAEKSDFYTVESGLSCGVIGI